MKDKEVNHVTQNESAKKVNLGEFFEGFSVRLTLLQQKRTTEVLGTQVVWRYDNVLGIQTKEF